jgi:hypothetical protein
MTKEEEMEARRNWRFRWLNLIFEFSHLEYQKGLWLDKKYPDEVGWFAEDICQYFDDLYLDDNYKYQLENSTISNQEYSIIKEFHFELDKFVEKTNKLGDKFNEKEILENKEWIKLCELGRIAWYGLKLLISNPTEKEHMEGIEQNYLEVKSK